VTEQFLGSWMARLDESISVCTKLLACNGFVFCSRKPWDTGNEYHNIAYELTSMLITLKL